MSSHQTKNVNTNIAKIQEMVAAGRTDKEISAELGVDRTTIVKLRRKLGIPGRPRGRPRKLGDEQAAAAAEAVARGVAVDEVAAELGVSSSTIRNAVRRIDPDLPAQMVEVREKPSVRYKWPWFGRPPRLVVPRRLAISNYSLVNFQRSIYTCDDGGVLRLDAERIQRFPDARLPVGPAGGLPRRYCPLPGMGRAGKRGRGGGLVQAPPEPEPV